MTKDFDFNLQLFAEEEVQQVEQPTVEDSTEQNTDDNFFFGIDENGDFVFSPDAFQDDLEEGEASEGQPENEGVANQVEEPDTNDTANETYIVKVNGQEQEVTLDELLHGYMRQADYSRKTQQLADERRNLQAPPMNQVPPAQQVAPQQQTQPTNPQFTQQQFYEQLTEFAKGAVKESFGVDYDPYNEVHNAVFANAIADVKTQMYIQQQAEQERIQSEQQFINNLSKYTSDPNFEAIDRLARQKLNELKYADAIKIQEAFNTRDWGIIDPYLAAVRNEYYGQQAPSIRPKVAPPKPAVKPPFVEAAGAAERTPDTSKKTYDLSGLGKMSNDSLADMFTKLGLTKL